MEDAQHLVVGARLLRTGEEAVKEGYIVIWEIKTPALLGHRLTELLQRVF